jgi:hypothetical protein
LFDAPGTWTNEGTIGALGGAPGYVFSGAYTYAGAGAGGVVNVFSSEIVNDGVIDVVDGYGGNTFGGQVILNVETGSSAPEPQTFVMLLLGLGAILAGKKKNGRAGGVPRSPGETTSCSL